MSQSAGVPAPACTCVWVGGWAGQHFGIDSVSALEGRQRMELRTIHTRLLDKEAVLVLCAVLGRPRVAARLAQLSLLCVPPTLCDRSLAPSLARLARHQP